MTTTDLNGNAAKLLLLLGMELGRSQRGDASSPLLPDALPMGGFTPGQLLDQSLGLAPSMPACGDPTSMVDQLLEDLFNNGQDNSALSMLNNQSMSELLALILALADQADQQLNQLGQNPMCPSRGLGNPFLSGGMPCLNPFNQGNNCWGNEDGGANCMDWAGYMDFAAEFSHGCLAPGASFGYGGACASSMFFGMNAEYGYGCASGGSYCVGGGGHAHSRGGCGIGSATMEADFCYSECSANYDYDCEDDCDDYDDCDDMDMCLDDCDDMELCMDDCDNDCSSSCEVSMDMSCEMSCESECVEAC